MKYLVIAMLLLIGASNAQSAVIFEESFDGQADWHNTKSFATDETCVAGTHAGVCAIPGWTKWKSDEIWNPYDATHPRAESRPGLEISNFAKRGASGKALIITNEHHKGTDSSGWGSDTILAKDLGADYKELYFQFYLRFQAGASFDWFSNGDLAMIKFFRTMHWGRVEASLPYSGGAGSGPAGGYNSNGPILFLDFGEDQYWGIIKPGFRCDPQETNYYCTPVYSNSASAAPFLQNGTRGTTLEATVADGNWHRYDLHVKYNTDTATADGVYEMWQDGFLVYSLTGMKYLDTGGESNIGMNAFMLGGNNLSDYPESGSSPSTVTLEQGGTPQVVREQWYAIDDVVVSTTPIASDYVISGGAVNGECGTSNGQNYTSSVPTNLCASGNVTDVTGHYAWSCEGILGGTTATCYTAPTTTANKIAGRYTTRPRPTLSCTSEGTCASTVYCLDFTNSCNPATTYTAAIENLLMNTAGPQYLRFKSTDTATNAETVQSLMFRKQKRR